MNLNQRLSPWFTVCQLSNGLAGRDEIIHVLIVDFCIVFFPSEFRRKRHL